MKIKQTIKKFIPASLWKKIQKVKTHAEAYQYHRRYNMTIERLSKKKEPLTVLFMAIYDSNWKYDSVYQAMQADNMFNPIIIVCPAVNRGREHMLESMDKCCRFFKKKNYTFIRSYDQTSDTFIDAHSFNPDIIFYTNPYCGLIDDRYYIDQFKNSLTCYVNYGYINVHFEWAVNLPFHQYVWRYFVECEDNKNLVKRFSSINASNCAVTGYPMYDAFYKGSANGIDWKIKDIEHKRIIWSPHHSISSQDGLIKLSTFELYYQTMVHLAEKYKNEVQFVFKPHPLLKDALYGLDNWGKDKTDAYYNLWQEMENTTIVEGEYIDLFNSSDAIINDSASFTIEYLYTKKPCLYLSNYDRQKDANEISLKALECWYHATAEQQIENFIVSVILKGNDYLKEKREKFFTDNLLPPNGTSAAENIINEIKRAVKK